MANRKTYKKSPGGAGSHGVNYQTNILALCLLEAYHNGDEFWLSTENDKGGKFDDVVLETNNRTILLQAKHKEEPTDKKNRITYNHIFPTGRNKEDLNIYKYAKSFSTIKNNFTNLNALILCTNANLTDKEDPIKKYISSTSMDQDHLLFFSDDKTFYRFNENCKDIIFREFPDYSEDDIDVFLKRYQLVVISDDNINRRIEQLVTMINIFNAKIDIKQSVQFLKETVKMWFEDQKGTYLTRLHVEAFRSQYFISQLNKLHVYFTDISNQKNRYTCYHIQKRANLILHLVKIYQHIKEYKVLIINPKDTIEIKQNIITSFQIDEYEYLVVVIFPEEYTALKQHISQIVGKTLKKSYKKIIFVTDNLNTVENLANELSINLFINVERIYYDNFSEITQKEISSRNIIFQGKHVSLYDLVYPHSEKLTEILDETTLCKLIQKKNIVIDDYRDYMLPFYMPRSIYCNNKKTCSDQPAMYENDFCDCILEATDTKTILITDGPGMGKSTLLTKLQKLFIEKYNHWIVKINLNDCTKIFRNCLINGSHSLSLDELLMWDKNPDDFATKVFNLPRKVIVMLDAFDEISPKYTDLVLDFIRYCENSNNVNKIIATSRKHCENDIMESLDVANYSLEPFSVQDQHKFLYDYWTEKSNFSAQEKYKCQEFVEKLTIKLTNTIGPDSWSFIGTPLQSHMLAGIFSKDCLDYIKSDSFKAKSLTKLNSAKLYERFLKEKKIIYIDEKTNAAGNVFVENTLNDKFDKLVEKEHTIIALQIIFDAEQYKYFEILQNKQESIIFNFDLKKFFKSKPKSKIIQQDPTNDSFKQQLFEIGILQKSGDSVQFIHRTLAEYLAAKYICTILSKPKVKYEFLYYLMNEVFSNVQYHTLRSFIDGILEDLIISNQVLKTCGEVTSKINWQQKYEIVNVGKSRHSNILKLMLEQCRDCRELLRTPSFINKDLFIESLYDFSLFQLMVKNGANIFKIYGKGKTVLHFACEYNCAEVINYLIENKLSVHARDNEGNTPLFNAVTSNSVIAVEIMLSKNVDINIRNYYNASPLYFAAKYNAVDTLSLLIKAGLAINHRDSTYSTPVLTACTFLSYRCLIYLINNGADLSATDNQQHSVLHRLAKKLPVRSTAFYTDVVKMIFEKSCIDINSVCSHGMTPLHYAVISGNVTMTKLLLSAGADKEKRNLEGATPLLVVCFAECLTCAEYLIKNEVNLSATDNKGFNVLHHLTKMGYFWKPAGLYTEIVRKILDRRHINLNNISDEGMTLLHYAVMANNEAMTHLLLASGADTEITNRNNLTPLLMACSEKFSCCAEILLEAGANITATNDEGCNILHNLAKIEDTSQSENSYTTIVNKILQTDRIKLNSRCNENKTAMDHAVEADNVVIQDLLRNACANN